MIVESTHPFISVNACKLFKSRCQDRKGRFYNDDSYQYGFGILIAALIDLDVVGCHKHVTRYAHLVETGITLSEVKPISREANP